MRPSAGRIRLAGAAALALALLPLSAAAQEVAEPKTGARFAAADDGMSLLGTGVRTRTMLKVKVYAVGLYVADEALRGPLASFKGRTSSADFYNQLVWGDFGKQVTMKFVRDVTRDQIQGAFRESLAAANRARLDAFLAYFSDTKSGQEYELRWVPGRGLVTTVAGQEKPAIDDKDFAAAVFGIWLGPKAIQEDIKRGLVARAAQAIP
jgi:hypothetical protein